MCDVYDNEWMTWSLKSKGLRVQMLVYDFNFIRRDIFLHDEEQVDYVLKKHIL